MESILTSIKKMLGIPEDYEQFDTDVMIHINTVLSILVQEGVGPAEGFRVSDKTSLWTDFLGEDAMFEDVKTFVFLKVKLLFDPPINGAVVEAYKENIKELEWRIYVKADSKEESIEEEVQNGE